MTIPNLITTLRIILVPIFVIYLINERFLAALTLFILAGLSDGADGLVARLLNQKSRLGSYLDPLADKFLIIAAFVVLATRDVIPPWLTVTVITRDILILLGVLILFLTKQDIVIKPSILSKLTTCLQLATVFLVLAGNHFHLFSRIIPISYIATGVLTVASGLHYMRSWFQMMGEGFPDNKAP
jgi:cardiolipin synthase